MWHSRRTLLALLTCGGLGAAAALAAPDLAIESVDTSALTFTCEPASASGNLSVTVWNLGEDPASLILLRAFDDRNGDGQWSAGEPIAGETTIADPGAEPPGSPLAPGAFAEVEIAIDLNQDFPADLIFVQADPEDTLSEENEDNNASHGGLLAAHAAPVAPEWEMGLLWSAFDPPGDIATTLLVADLIDEPDHRGIPEVVPASATPPRPAGAAAARLRPLGVAPARSPTST